ncbi:hypothetical protein ElyMa_000991900 [Elysia marginata]|uniref:Uncharacterized protein n=1 Tax=Elysia marginata TaxID=1093978 RepID=A0AAV4HL75_9GAST|nr:hypothetical protein ElyMa_000991900 [Elysia marginata]
MRADGAFGLSVGRGHTAPGRYPAEQRKEIEQLRYRGKNQRLIILAASSVTSAELDGKRCHLLHFFLSVKTGLDCVVDSSDPSMSFFFQIAEPLLMEEI